MICFEICMSMEHYHKGFGWVDREEQHQIHQASEDGRLGMCLWRRRNVWFIRVRSVGILSTHPSCARRYEFFKILVVDIMKLLSTATSRALLRSQTHRSLCLIYCWMVIHVLGSKIAIKCQTNSVTNCNGNKLENIFFRHSPIQTKGEMSFKGIDPRRDIRRAAHFRT